MASLPPITDFTGATKTEGDIKTFVTGLRNYLVGLFGSSGNVHDAHVALGTPFNSSALKTAAYTVVAADRGKVIKCTGTWSLAFTAAATLGDGFYVEVVNDGAGTITLDPNGSETVNGATTKTLLAGASVIVYCDGTKFILLGGGVTAADIAAALGYTPANLANAASDHNHSGTYVPITVGNVVGSIMLMTYYSGSGNPSIGTSYGCSSNLVSAGGSYWSAGAYAVTGTWLCLGFVAGAAALFRKVA